MSAHVHDPASVRKCRGFCFNTVCDECARWYGNRPEPGATLAKCPDCDYNDYLGSHGA